MKRLLFGLLFVYKRLTSLSLRLRGKTRAESAAARMRSGRAWNEFCDALMATGGDPRIAYYHSYWRPAADEALVIHTPIPSCEHWNFQANSIWMQSLDYRYNRIHINGEDANLNSDGTVLPHAGKRIRAARRAARSQRLLAPSFYMIHPVERLDPEVATNSFFSMVWHSTRIFSRHTTAADPAHHWLRKEHGSDRFIDPSYCDLTSHPMAAPATVYARLGLGYSDDRRRRLRQVLAHHRKNRYGVHHHARAAFALDTTVWGRAFAEYRAAFDIPHESRG